MDVATAVSTAEGNTKLHWLLDALEISCISEYPSTVRHLLVSVSVS